MAAKKGSGQKTVVKRSATTGEFVGKGGDKGTFHGTYGAMRGTITFRGDIVTSPFAPRKSAKK